MNASEIVALRSEMLRFAKLQLCNEELAEDAVQDAITAALSGSQQFAGKAQIKTWVFSILRNKIIDLLRERIRHPTHPFEDDDSHFNEEDELFDERGFWRKSERPIADWGDPESALASHQFWNIFESCLTFLPESTARVFMIREFIGFDTTEICKELNISESNCWVMLHRARMRLRICLEKNWFHHGESKNAHL